MEYTRVELQFVRGAWARGVRVHDIVPGPIRAVAVDPVDRTVAYTVVSPKHARPLAAEPTSPGGRSSASGTTSGAPGHVEVLVAGTRVVAVRHRVGVVSRVWVERSTGRVTHVLARVPGGFARSGPEHIVPVDLIESFAHGAVTLKIGVDALVGLPIYRPDAVIARDIADVLGAVLADPRARRAVKIHVEDGEVLLSGEVDTTEQARAVEQAVAAVPGVRGMTLDVIAQEMLAAAVERRITGLGTLARDEHAHIEVLAEHGIVHLEGYVPSQDARAAVERAALQVPGAKVVVNNLRVDGESSDRGPGTGPLVRNR